MTKKIKLTQNKYAIVDAEDFEYLNQWKWHLNAQGYAVRKPYVKGSGRKNQKTISVRMHMLVNNTPDGMETDHINRNKLDNRRENLRTVTSSQNKFNSNVRADNTSGVKGVTWDKANNKWKASISANQRHLNLGRFDSIEQATIARKDAENIYIQYA